LAGAVLIGVIISIKKSEVPFILEIDSRILIMLRKVIVFLSSVGSYGTC